MSKKSTKALASAALMSLVLTTALSAGPVKAAQGKVTRVSGADRYATASQVATANWESGSDSVVLVSGEGYADAVSASALAKKLGAPILLTEPGSLNADAQKALDTLKPKNVYVIGGNASISQSIRDGLKDKYTLTELGGANRYETNAAVADELVKLGVDASNVLVVGGEGFSDALSVAPVAAAKGQILLLATNDQAKTQPVIDFVKKNNSKATVVGTKNIINDTIYNALGASSRVDGGADRFATNIKVLNNFQGDLKSDKVYIANASKAAPDNLYADALVASAVAGKYSAPLVLVDKDPSGSTTNPNATDNAIAYLKDNTTSSTDFQVIGGTGVVSENTVEAINEIYNPSGDQATEVQSVEAVGLNQIKVIFNGEVDSDTAETVSNYKVDGTSLVEQSDTDTGDVGEANVDKEAKAVLQDDNKTVLITLAKPRQQSDDVDVTVKKGILSADKSENVPEFTQSVDFSDTTAPTLESVSVKGNSKITVKFSEALDLGTINELKSKFKINGQNIGSLGLDEQYSEIKDSVKGPADKVWSDEVDFYFNSKLDSGNNTLKISDGDNDGVLTDAAGFPFKETTEDFNVDSISGSPEITSITAEDSGKVYVNFDRPMDEKTAKVNGNYKINGTQLTSSNSTIDLKKGDTQVKISGVSGLLNKNANTIYIDDNVKDAYGNKVADDTTKSFDLDEDDTKPAVSSVTLLDDDTIRVRFSKDVRAIEATDKSNYKLVDKSGTNINLDNANFTIPGKSEGYVVKDTDSTDVVDLNFDDDLTDSKYTITIKNITDTSSDGNQMDEYVETIDGAEDVAPEVDTITTGSSDRKVVVNFSKEMDSSSIQELSNYKFRNGNGDLKSLPSDTDISVSSDNKSAIIEFPDNYTVREDGYVGTVGDNDVIELDVLDSIKDINGNALEISVAKPISIASNITTVNPNSVKVYYEDGNDDDLKVDFKFTKSIDDFNYKEFAVNGVQADTGYKNSDVVTLVFNTDATVDAVKNKGKDAVLTIINPTTKEPAIRATDTKDVSGNPVAIQTDADTGDAEVGTVTPYFYKAAPKTIKDDWTATVNDSEADVNIVFDAPIYKNSVRTDDFTFRVGGSTLDADDFEVTKAADAGDKNTVTFKFTKSDSIAKFKANRTVKITAKETTSISGEKDENGDYAYYVPSSEDKETVNKTIYVNDVTEGGYTINESASGNTLTIASGVTGTADGFKAAFTDFETVTVKNASNNAKETDETLVTGDKVTATLKNGETVIYTVNQL
ncbi:cell wall-binding repeat-containing protein [Clostridium sp. WLY-B-L2]|uniref:Cell wall-binding repeat-containing protein n=1 Tax=Clostridium aromativorans TaxID=2836848 RepID=A0ABS8N3B6_9CLOT|nr:cell wall-binding repeat-containing protein [Clostridium aromativorans]MCC9294267.1 cell wall-binding repeat-containing protein [Clostridium aromativorans]